MSVTRQEVVRSRAATLAAFSRAVRTTLAGSMIPASIRSQAIDSAVLPEAQAFETVVR